MRIPTLDEIMQKAYAAETGPKQRTPNPYQEEEYEILDIVVPVPLLYIDYWCKKLIQRQSKLELRESTLTQFLSSDKIDTEIYEIKRVVDSLMLILNILTNYQIPKSTVDKYQIITIVEGQFFAGVIKPTFSVSNSNPEHDEDIFSHPTEKFSSVH